MRRLLATVAAAILAAGLLGTVVPVAAAVVPPPPPPADAPSYYPSGPQYDIPVATLESAGWTRCFQEPYSNLGITSIISLQNACDGDYLILTGREIGTSTLNILAAAPRADVFTVTAENEPRLVNGTYWYFTPIEDGDAQSMGFSTDATILQYSCDYDYEEEAPVAGGLCWHISDFDGTPKLDDGFSLDGLDLNENPFGDGDSYYREAYEFTVDATDPNCGALDLSVCPTITSGTRGLIGAPGTSHVANRAIYTWLRCTVPGAAAEGPRAPATCRTIRSSKATGAQMAVRPYGVTSRDAKAGYIRLAVKVGTRTYYSGAYSVAP